MVEFGVAPVTGRVFEGAATVRLGDSSPGGRARLDAIARHLQDVSDDDASAAGFGDLAWVVRRTAIAVHSFPTYGEAVTMRTWCAGFGAAWAERRISAVGDRGGRVESATVWVHLNGQTHRPARLPPAFREVFEPSAQGRRVDAAGNLERAAADAWATAVPWPLRFVDFDVLGHVNNAVYWAAVEQELAARRDLRAPLTAVIEHGEAIEREHEVRWSVRDRAGGFDGWLIGAGGEQFAAVTVSAGI